jgi:hypothetical protein
VGMLRKSARNGKSQRLKIPNNFCDSGNKKNQSCPGSEVVSLWMASEDSDLDVSVKSV